MCCVVCAVCCLLGSCLCWGRLGARWRRAAGGCAVPLLALPDWLAGSRLQARGIASAPPSAGFKHEAWAAGSSRRRARAARCRWRAAAAARAARVRQRVCGCAGVAAAAVSPSATTPAARRRGRGTRRTAAHGRRQLRQRLVAESVRQQSGRRCAHAAASCAACPPAVLCVLCKRCGSQGPTRVAAAGPGALENSSWRCLRGGR